MKTQEISDRSNCKFFRTRAPKIPIRFQKFARFAQSLSALFRFAQAILFMCVISETEPEFAVWFQTFADNSKPYSGRALGNRVSKSSNPTHSGVIVIRTIC